MTTILDPEFWAVLGTLTVLGAATAIGLTLAAERLIARLAARPHRSAPARRRTLSAAAARRHRHAGMHHLHVH